MQRDISLAKGIRLSSGHAVYCRDDNALAIADLHLGYEAALQAEHVSIPRFQLEPMLERLSMLLGTYRPDTLIINGDLKHDFSRNKGQEWDEVESLLGILEGIDVKVVRGNHDNYLQTILVRRDIEIVESFNLLGGITFQHGHKNIPSDGGFMIYAHEHPVIRMKDEIGAHIKLPCFLYDADNNFMIMPAFSPLASGTNVISPEASFMNPVLRKMDMSGARVFVIHDGIMDFGAVGDLREMREETYLDRMKDRNTR